MQWLLLIVPVAFMKLFNMKLSDIGFTKQKIATQIFIGVAFVEEIFYRGFLFERVLNISQSKWAAIIISSCVFGLSHIVNGNIR